MGRRLKAGVCDGAPYLVVARAHEGIVAQITAYVGGYDLAVDAIARHKVFVLPRGRRRRRLAGSASLSRHGAQGGENGVDVGERRKDAGGPARGELEGGREEEKRGERARGERVGEQGGKGQAVDRVGISRGVCVSRQKAADKKRGGLDAGWRLQREPKGRAELCRQVYEYRRAGGERSGALAEREKIEKGRRSRRIVESDNLW